MMIGTSQHCYRKARAAALKASDIAVENCGLYHLAAACPYLKLEKDQILNLLMGPLLWTHASPQERGHRQAWV